MSSAANSKSQRLQNSILVGLAVLVIGALIWIFVGRDLASQLFSARDLLDETGETTNEDDHHDHVDISVAAAKSLGITLEPLTRSTYTRMLHIPASVIEKPGQSNLSVTSPIQGIITEIHRFPGQALEPDDLLFTLRVTDEALEAAQLSLLEILTRVAVTEREIERLDPLTESGVVVGRRKLEMEYQLKQLESERAARLQELKLRGLSAEQVERIVQYRELINQVEIRLNILPISVSTSPSERETDAEKNPGPIYTLEQLNVFPGLSVNKGQELCHIANHHNLYVRADAFDSDLVHIRRAMERQEGVVVETGEKESRERIEDLRIMYMDNHADLQSQTFPFYLLLPNQVVAEQRDDAGRLFRSWRFKPGQRAHVYLPVEQWPDQIVLPRDAVVRSGPETYVFRLTEDNWRETERISGDFAAQLVALERLPEWELEPVPVQVLHQDRQFVVLATDGELTLNDIVVTSRAYQVFLAWKMQLSGGGGHDHDHDH